MSIILLSIWHELSEDLLGCCYGAVPAPFAIEAREAAQRIRLRLRRSAEDIIEIGRDLLAVKARLPHGSFLPAQRDAVAGLQ